MHSNIYTFVRLCVTRLCIQYPFICTCENRQPGNREPCEPVPVGRGPRAASARRRSTRRRRSARTSARGTPRPSPRWPMYAPLPARRRALRRPRSGGLRMRRGLLCAVAPPMRARVRTRVGARLRGALGVGMDARRGGSVHDPNICVCIYIYMFVCCTLTHALSIYL
jgi:hypothetical protein